MFRHAACCWCDRSSVVRMTKRISPRLSDRLMRRRFLAGAPATVVASQNIRRRLFAEGRTMQDTQFSKNGLQRLHETMASYVASEERPGLVTLLSRNGETHA